MMKMKQMLIVMMLMLFVAACAPAATPAASPSAPNVPTSAPSMLPTPPASPLDPGSASSTGQETAVANSRADLAQRLNIDPGAITVVSVEAVQWPDGCLGIQTPGIMCTMVITPGYRVILQADGKQYEYHTDASGETARLATVAP